MNLFKEKNRKRSDITIQILSVVLLAVLAFMVFGPQQSVAATAADSFSATAAGPDAIYLNWSSNEPVEYYFIYRSSGSSYVLIATVAGGDQTYLDSGLDQGIEYSYRIMDCNNNALDAGYLEASAIIPRTN